MLLMKGIYNISTQRKKRCSNKFLFFHAQAILPAKYFYCCFGVDVFMGFVRSDTVVLLLLSLFLPVLLLLVLVLLLFWVCCVSSVPVNPKRK